MKSAFKGPAGFFLLALLLSAPLYFQGLMPLDEGALVHIADRLNHGEVLYRDVATGVMPGIYYLLALLYRVFGTSIEIGRVLEMFVLAASTSLIYLIVRRYCSAAVPSAAALLFVCVELSPYRLPNYSPLSILFILVGFLLFVDYLEHLDLRRLAGAGVALSLAVLSKQNYGVQVFAALALTIVVDSFLRERRRLLVAPVVFASSFALPIAATLGYLAYHGAIREFFDYTVVSVFSGTLPAFFKPYPILDFREPLFFETDPLNYTPFQPLFEVVQSLGTQVENSPVVSVIVAGVFLLVPVVLLLGVLGVFGRFLRSRLIDTRDLALTLAAVALFVGVYPRSDFHHLALVLSLPLVLGAVVYERVAVHFGRRRILSVATGVATGVLAIGSVVPPFVPRLAGLPSRPDTVLGIDRARHIRLPESEAVRLRLLVDGVRERVSPDESFLVIPNDPLIYFLAGRRNASPFPLVLPGSFDEDRLIESLEGVDTVLYRDWVSYEDTSVESLFPRTAGILEATFQPVPEYLPTSPNPRDNQLFLLERVGAGGMSLEERQADDSYSRGLRLGDRLDEAAFGIFLANGIEYQPEKYDLVAVEARPWMLHSAISVRPARNWAKILLSYSVSIGGEASLEFEASRGFAGDGLEDGVVLQVHASSLHDDSHERLYSRFLHPAEVDWHGDRVALDLSRFKGQDVVLTFAVWGGPSDEDDGEHLILRRPRIGGEAELHSLESVPKQVATYLSRSRALRSIPLRYLHQYWAEIAPSASGAGEVAVDLLDRLDSAEILGPWQDDDNPTGRTVAGITMERGLDLVPGIFMLPKASLRYDLGLVDGSSIVFRAAVGVHTRAQSWGGDGFIARVSIGTADSEPNHFDYRVTPQQGFVPIELDLTGKVGRGAQLTLGVLNEADMDEVGDWAVWERPRLERER